MNESQLRDGLRTVLADEPPLGFDPDAVVDVARAATRRRRALVGSVAATVMVAVAAVVGVAGLGGGPPPGPAASGTTPASTPAPTPPSAQSPSSVQAPPASDPRGLAPHADRMIRHLRTVLPQLVPGATDITVVSSGQEAHGDYSIDNTITMSLRYRDAVGQASLSVEVWGPGMMFQIPPCVGAAAGRCDPITRQDGTMVFFHESELSGASPDHRHRTAYHERPGNVVMISTYTYLVDDHAAAPRTGFPLTDDQLVALVTDPELMVP